MRSRLFLLSTIIGACLVAVPAVSSAQRDFHSDRLYRRYDQPRYRYHYDFGARAETAQLRADARAARAEARTGARAESRAESRLESRASIMRRSIDRDFRRRDLSLRIRDRIEASRARSRYRW